MGYTLSKVWGMQEAAFGRCENEEVVIDDDASWWKAIFSFTFFLSPCMSTEQNWRRGFHEIMRRDDEGKVPG
jgi:hypothetical protein